MTYQVEISSVAEQEAESAFLHISQTSSFGKARYWYAGLLDTIGNLKTTPKRSQMVVSSKNSAMEYRQVLYGQGANLYQILFTIIEDQDFPTICVHHVRPNQTISLVKP